MRVIEREREEEGASERERQSKQREWDRMSSEKMRESGTEREAGQRG